MSIISKNIYRGFTIVELLIVIVVIGILAAISIVAYNGIQDRARASIIQSDLAAAAKQILLYKAGVGAPPTDGTSLYKSEYHNLKGTFTIQEGVDPYHLVAYCTDGSDFVLAARQENHSPTRYYIVKTSGGVVEAPSSTPATGSSTTLCNALGFPDLTNQYRTWLKSYSTINRGWSLDL